MKCPGDELETCGGIWANNVHQILPETTPESSLPEKKVQFGYLGKYIFSFYNYENIKHFLYC